MTTYPANVRFPKLKHEHLEFGRVLIDASFGVLTNSFDAFNDVDIAVRHLMMVFEGFNKLTEWRERFDILVRIDVSYFGVFIKSISSKISLKCLRNFDKPHVFLYAEGQALAVVNDVSVPSNVSGSAILIFSVIFVCVLVCLWGSV